MLITVPTRRKLSKVSYDDGGDEEEEEEEEKGK